MNGKCSRNKGCATFWLQALLSNFFNGEMGTLSAGTFRWHCTFRSLLCFVLPPRWDVTTDARRRREPTKLLVSRIVSRSRFLAKEKKRRASAIKSVGLRTHGHYRKKKTFEKRSQKKEVNKIINGGRNGIIRVRRKTVRVIFQRFRITHGRRRFLRFTSVQRGLLLPCFWPSVRPKMFSAAR